MRRVLLSLLIAASFFVMPAGGQTSAAPAASSTPSTAPASGGRKKRVAVFDFDFATVQSSSAAVFGTGCALAAIMPGFWLFGAVLVVIGISALLLLNFTNSMMQLTTEPAMRGRMMAFRLGVAMGGTPIGAPIVGRVVDDFGPRWGLGVGAAAGLVAAAVVVVYLARYQRREGDSGESQIPTEGNDTFIAP